MKRSQDADNEWEVQMAKLQRAVVMNQLAAGLEKS